MENKIMMDSLFCFVNL